MDLAGVNMQTLIHLGIEILVVGGLTFWVHRRVGGMESTVEELTKKIAALEGLVERQQQLLAQHDNILRQIIGAPIPQHTPTKSELPQHQPTPIKPELAQRQHIPVKSPPEPPRRPTQPPAPEPEVDSSVLDAILEKELGSIGEIEIETTVEEFLVPKKTIKRKKGEVVKKKGQKVDGKQD